MPYHEAIFSKDNHTSVQATVPHQLLQESVMSGPQSGKLTGLGSHVLKGGEFQFECQDDLK